LRSPRAPQRTRPGLVPIRVAVDKRVVLVGGDRFSCAWSNSQGARVNDMIFVSKAIQNPSLGQFSGASALDIGTRMGTVTWSTNDRTDIGLYTCYYMDTSLVPYQVRASSLPFRIVTHI